MWVKEAPHGRPPPLSTPCRGQSFTAVACHKNVAKMLLSSANLLLLLLLLLLLFMLSVALSEVLCRQQIREPISKMLTPSIGQLNSFFIHLTLRLCPMPNPIPSLDTVGSPVETEWHIALHSTPLQTPLLWHPIFSWMNLHSPNTFLYDTFISPTEPEFNRIYGLNLRMINV